MNSVQLTLTADWQNLQTLIDVQRAADLLPPIDSPARVKRFVGAVGNAGLVHITRTPVGNNISYSLNQNDPSPVFGLTAEDNIAPNSYWVKADTVGDKINVEVEE